MIDTRAPFRFSSVQLLNREPNVCDRYREVLVDCYGFHMTVLVDERADDISVIQALSRIAQMWAFIVWPAAEMRGAELAEEAAS